MNIIQSFILNNIEYNIFINKITYYILQQKYGIMLWLFQEVRITRPTFGGNYNIEKNSRSWFSEWIVNWNNNNKN